MSEQRFVVWDDETTVVVHGLKNVSVVIGDMVARGAIRISGRKLTGDEYPGV